MYNNDWIKKKKITLLILYFRYFRYLFFKIFTRQTRVRVECLNWVNWNFLQIFSWLLKLTFGNFRSRAFEFIMWYIIVCIPNDRSEPREQTCGRTRVPACWASSTNADRATFNEIIIVHIKGKTLDSMWTLTRTNNKHRRRPVNIVVWVTCAGRMVEIKAAAKAVHKVQNGKSLYV